MAYTIIMDDTVATMDALDVSMDGNYPHFPIGDITEPKDIAYPTSKDIPYQEGKSISYPPSRDIFEHIKQ